MNGVVFEGGGARGSYHVGAYEFLLKRNIKINCAVGTSIGSINAAFIAANDFKNLKKLWLSFSSKEIFGIDQELLIALKNKKFTKENIYNGIHTVTEIIKNSGIDINVLKNNLEENLDTKRLKKSKIDFGLVTYNISKREKVRIFKKDIPENKIVEYLIASSYLPIFKTQKIIDDCFYFDGGIFDDCPVDMLLDKKLDTIYVIRTHSNKLKKYKTNSKIIEIKPSCNLGSIIGFDKKVSKFNFQLGYYDAMKAIDNLDGYKYYFKNNDISYYRKLLDKEDKKKYFSKFGKHIVLNDKKAIISILESMCEEYNINRFKVYDVKMLIIKFKIINLLKKKTIYSEFIRKLKVII